VKSRCSGKFEDGSVASTKTIVCMLLTGDKDQSVIVLKKFQVLKIGVKGHVWDDFSGLYSATSHWDNRVVSTRLNYLTTSNYLKITKRNTHCVNSLRNCCSI